MSDGSGDSGLVRLDQDLAELLDQLGSTVAAQAAPSAPAPGSVAEVNADATLLLMVADTGRAIEAIATQVTILRNEMRLTMLDAIAADTAVYIEAISLPEES